MYETDEKLPLRRLEPVIHKFIKVAIPTDLERLRKHQVSIEKYHRCQLWARLHKEHVNAGRTVQQLRVNIHEMEKVCLRVREEDSQALMKIISPVEENAADATSQFLQILSHSAEGLRRQHSLSKDPLKGSCTTGPLCENEGMTHSQIEVHVSTLPQIPDDQNARESWQTLESDLMDLSKLVTEFSEIVHSQQVKIDTIEENINMAAVDVEEGTKILGKMAKMNVVALPLAGAFLGGVIGGPLGLLAGLKVGGIAAALGGGILGFTGGKLIQKKKENNIQKELYASCPEFNIKAEELCFKPSESGH
ncbi:LOW QUALITY PROTEIN: syntaxin-17 [Pleurodeles waltl]|uniref:LOW QUALITY PROTEIN: syntaxin-17 n=1 Tax=Pleurodeles waltl TaxID=8319 RepID=UPI003709721F